VGLKADNWILAKQHFDRIIEPFVSHQVREENGKKIISYGLSSYGYDIRCADEFKVFTNINTAMIDPKNFDENAFVDFTGEVCIIPPNSFALARSLEFFRMPNDVLGICLGKSTLARCGLVVNITPLEPAWRGHLTIEISNTTPLPAKIYANEGIAQLLFFEGDETCSVNYAMRHGKYNNQQGITLAQA
jgi:dCTP deaminase